MIGNIIMAINTVLQLASPVVSVTGYSHTDERPSLVITMRTDDNSRATRTDNNGLDASSGVNELPQYIRTDRGPLFSITISSAPDPVIPGTRVQIYRIAALLDGGADIASIMDDYPSLTQDQIEEAWEYAKVNPNPGRQYPNRSFKRALLEMDFHKYLR